MRCRMRLCFGLLGYSSLWLADLVGSFLVRSSHEKWMNGGGSHVKFSLSSINHQRGGAGREGRSALPQFDRLRNMSITEIDNCVRRHAAGPDAPLRSLSSYEETDFIRLLRDLDAPESIPTFLRVASQNVYTYTAAIAALAVRNRTMAIEVYEQMLHEKVAPSSYTLAAVFQAARGPDEVIRWRERFKTQQPQVLWSTPVWESAIAACCADGEGECDCDLALHLLEQMKLNAAPTVRAYTTLFQHAMATRNLTMALMLVEELVTVAPTNVRQSPRVWGVALQMFAAQPDADRSSQLLLRMNDAGMTPNVRHYTSYLKALVAQGNLSASVAVLEHMAGLRAHTNVNPPTSIFDLGPVAPDLIAFQTVLGGCTRYANHSFARDLLERARKGEFGSGLLPDLRCYNLVLGTCTEPNEAKTLIGQMRLSRRHRVGVVTPNHVSYTLAIAACRKAADSDSAIFLLRQAEDDGIVPDVYMFSAAIWAAAEACNFPLADQLLDEMIRNGIEPNIVAYNGVIASATCDQLEGATARYLELMAPESKVTPSYKTFQVFARLARKVDDLEQRLSVLTRIVEGWGPEEWRVNVGGPVIEELIYVCRELNQHEDGVHIFDSIEGPADAVTLRAVLFACSSASPPLWEDALRLLHTSDIIPGTSLPARMDSVALSYAMLACSKADQWTESLQLLRLYGAAKPSPVTVNSLIAACGRAGRTDIAIEVLNEMRLYGIHPSERSYRTAIIACNQAEHEKRRQKRRNATTNRKDEDGAGWQWWECALSLIQRMKEENLVPHVQAYSSAISACEAAGQWQRALGLLQGMLDDDLQKLNLYCFNAAISACEKGGAWIEALEVYERMKEYGGVHLRPNKVTIASLVLALDTAGQKELAQSVYEEGVSRAIVNPWRTALNATGTPCQAMDLHTFSAAMARAAIRSHLDFIIHGRSRIEDWTIIVGKGIRSNEEPVLMPNVLQLLRKEFALECTVDARNTGRILVPENALRRYALARR